MAPRLFLYDSIGQDVANYDIIIYMYLIMLTGDIFQQLFTYIEAVGFTCILLFRQRVKINNIVIGIHSPCLLIIESEISQFLQVTNNFPIMIRIRMGNRTDGYSNHYLWIDREVFNLWATEVCYIYTCVM